MYQRTLLFWEEREINLAADAKLRGQKGAIVKTS